MAFNPALDKIHRQWTLKTGLQVSVHSYNNGERKVQIGPRVYEKRNGDVGFNKVGRLTNEEFTEMAGISAEIFNILGNKEKNLVYE